MKVRIKLIKSVIGQLPKHRKTVHALGLRKISSSVEHEATEAILGMARAVSHLVAVEEMK